MPDGQYVPSSDVNSDASSMNAVAASGDVRRGGVGGLYVIYL